jgi:hypothetical protein
MTDFTEVIPDRHLYRAVEACCMDGGRLIIPTSVRKLIRRYAPFASQIEQRDRRAFLAELADLTECALPPIEAVQINITPHALDYEQLTSFLQALIAVAEPVIGAGSFVACGYGETPGTYEALRPQIHVVDYSEDGLALTRLIEAFDAINTVPGLNAYISIGLFKPRHQWCNPRGRGSEADLIGTMAFVGDFDAGRGHKPETCLDRLPCEPSLIVETSAGNYQPWIFLDRPYPASEAKPLFAALTRSMGSDSTFSCEHIFRPPGTWNWPTQKKVRDYGRALEPQLARIVEFLL